MLIWTLKGSLYSAIDQLSGHTKNLSDCLAVGLTQCCMLVLLYCLYVLVCAHFHKVERVICPHSSDRRRRRGRQRRFQYDSGPLSGGYVYYGRSSDSSAGNYPNDDADDDMYYYYFNDDDGNGDGGAGGAAHAHDREDVERVALLPSNADGVRSAGIVSNSSGGSGAGAGGGGKYVFLLMEDMPSHSHTVSDRLAAEASSRYPSIDSNASSSSSSTSTSISASPSLSTHPPGITTAASTTTITTTMMTSKVHAAGAGAAGVSAGAGATASAVVPDMEICVHEIEDSVGSFKCYLFKRSSFYSKLSLTHSSGSLLSSYQWQLKWITIDEHGLHYCRNRARPDVGVRFLDIFHATRIEILDDEQLIFRILFDTSGGRSKGATRKRVDFQAPNDNVFDAVLQRLNDKIALYSRMSAEARDSLSVTAQEALQRLKRSLAVQFDDDSLLKAPPPLPSSSSSSLTLRLLRKWSLLWHNVLYPLKLVLFYTTIDLRQAKYRGMTKFAVLSLLLSLLWLFVFSYFMTISSQMLAAYLGLSSSVMGLTVSAIGSSFPNLLSSVAASRQGMGRLAVTTAFGANVFSVCVGLGIPWMLFILSTSAFGSGHHSGHMGQETLKDEGIVFTVAILIIATLLFLLLMAVHHFQLKLWMAPAFIAFYIAYVVYAVLFTTHNT